MDTNKSEFEYEIAESVILATSLGINGLSMNKPYKLEEELLISTHIYFCTENIPRLKSCDNLELNGKTYSTIFEELYDSKEIFFDFKSRVVKSSISTILDDRESNKAADLYNKIANNMDGRWEDKSPANTIYFINDDLIKRTMDDFFSTSMFQNKSLPLSSFEKRFALTMKSCQELIDKLCM